MKKKYLAIGLASALLLGAAAFYGIKAYQRFNPSWDRKYDIANFVTRYYSHSETRNSGEADTDKFGSLNLQAFGTAKSHDKVVMDIVSSIITNFDLIALQEVRDLSGKALPLLFEEVKKKDPSYAYLMSPPLGRGKAKGSIKENYVFMYRKGRVEYTGVSYVYTNSLGLDLFEREPYVASFKAGKFSFLAVNIHTKPDNATQEIGDLERVLTEARSKMPPNKDVIVFGDYNADGKYFHEKAENIGIRSERYLWIIPDGYDTSMGKETNTYDRIVIPKESTLEDYAGEFGTFKFDEAFRLSPENAKKISDHRAIWAKFYINRDTD